MTDEERINAASVRYHAAAHAMQSGVATEMERNKASTSKKHLRVGVNSAHSDIASLAKLLIRKGIISEVEYVEALAEGMEAEKARYEEHLSQNYFGGQKVTLG